MLKRNCRERSLKRFVVILMMAISAGLLSQGTGFAETPQYVEVEGITSPSDANGVYEKQSDPHGYHNHEYWMMFSSEGNYYYIYSDEWGDGTGDYYWNIDTDLDDEASSLFYSNTGSYDYDGFAALDSPDLVYDDWSYWNGSGDPVVSIYGVDTPEINVLGNENDIDDGDDTPSFDQHTRFGSAERSSGTLTRTFTIENKGTAALSVSGVAISGDDAEDFSVSVSPDASVAASGTTSFEVTFSPSSTGVLTAEIVISNDDSNEAEYNFTIEGYGFIQGDLEVSNIKDTSEASHAANGTYLYQGVLNRFRYWKHETEEYYVFNDEYNSTGSWYWNIDVDTDDTDDDYLFYKEAEDGSPQGLAGWTAGSGVHASYDPIIAESGVTYVEIQLYGNDVSIQDEDETPCMADHTAFGSLDIASSSTTRQRTFTIENKGNADLTIDGVAITGTHAEEFSVTTEPDATVAAGGTTTFIVEFEPATTGEKTATISISNDDDDEGTYTFAINGYGVTSKELTVSGIDSPTAANGTYSYLGIINEFQYWQNGSYYIYNDDYDGTRYWNIDIDTDDTDDTTWLFYIASEAADPAGLTGWTVNSSNTGVSGTPEIALAGPEMDVLGNSTSIADGDATPDTSDDTDFGSIAAASGTLSKTYTIRNTGGGALALSGDPIVSVTADSDFSVSSQPSASAIAADDELTFTVAFDPSVIGTCTAEISIANDDSDENPYNFTIQGIGLNTAPVLDATGTMTLTSITEDATDPAGDTVASIIASAGGDRITDADSSAAEGIAITGVTGDGTWQYNTGSGWSAVGTVSGSSALLLSDTASLRFVPTASNNDAQTATVTFSAWDQTSDSEGAKVDVSTSNGGTTAFSTTEATATLLVTAVNDAPVITSTAGTTATEDVAYSYTVTATDAEGDTLGYTLSNAPGGMTVSGNEITWTPTEGVTTSGVVTLTVSDGSLSDTQDFTVSVTAVNDAPVITSTAGTTATEDVAYSYTVTATDAEGDTLGYTLSNAPSGMTVSGNEITWTPTEGVTTSGVVTLTVSDGSLSDTQDFTVSVTAVNDAPVITSTAGTTATEDVAYSYTVTATDAEGDTLSYSLSNAPSGMTVSGNEITWTPTEGVTTSGVVTLTVSDGSLSDTQDFTISVTAVNDAPVITGQENLHTAEETPLTITLGDLIVTDPDNTYPNDFTLSVLDGTNYTRSGNTITPSAGFAGGDLTVPVTVNDGTQDSGVYSLAVYVGTQRTVGNTDDSGAGSLRQALLDAVDGDVIDLSEVTGTITLESGLAVEKDVEIRGSETDGIVIDANSAGRVFDISAGATVAISDVTVTNGLVADPGGGIANAGALTLVRVTVNGNETTGGTGGGIYSTGDLTMRNCTVSGNVASGEGGGICNMSGSTLALNNCTIALNESSSGAIGGLYNEGDLDIGNTLISDNTSADTGGSGAIGTNIANLVADGSLSGAGSGDPGLGPLQDNGGSGFTHGLSYGSIAIDAGDSATAEAADQRGTSRPVDGNLDDNALPDIGAFEYFPGVIEFSADTYSAGESDGTVTITVVRTGTGEGAASATVATSDGTATAGSDYTAASGTLTWSDGDISEKTMAITIADDVIAEGNETINLTLTGITGAGDGSILSAGVTIEDNDVYYTLTTTVTGAGAGSITSSPSGIDCGSDCSATYYAGTTVTLTATAGNECSAFSGWSGGACSGTDPCTIGLTADTGVTAVFDLPDTDGDGVPDCNDAFPEDPGETADGDGDGIGDNADTDHDNDGMPTDWENENGLDPLTDDADLDPDGDGLTNLEEYETGTDPQVLTTGLGRAVLAAPADGATEVSVPPTLETTYGDDADESVHTRTRWQIASDESFEDVLLDITSDDYITGLTVPAGILDSYRTCYWRARYVDSDDTVWPWSESWTFTTTQAYADDNGNGLPDDQELAQGTQSDLDDDGEDDLSETDMHCIMLPDDSGWTCLEDAAGGRVEAFFAVDPEEIPEAEGQPDEFPYGLFGYRVVLDTPGDSVTVTQYYSVALPANVSWYKYDSVSGWFDYTGYVTFRLDRKIVYIELTDGGYGDADGVANGVIVDPSGPAIDSDSNSGNSGGSCFITTVSGRGAADGEW